MKPEMWLNKKMESIQLVLLFEKGNISIQEVARYFENQLQAIFGSTFHELSYSYISDNNFKSKNLQYSGANLEKLYKASTLNGFELLCLLDDWKYKSKDIKFSARFTPDFNKKCSCISLTLSKKEFLKKFDEEAISKLYLDVVKYIRDFGLRLVYGFIFSMDSEKFPAMYVAGIGNYQMSKNEEENLQVWAENNDRSDVAIWNLFWGNLITKNHLTHPDDLTKLRELVGKDHFYEIDDSTFFFVVPDSKMDYDRKNSPLVVKVSNLLKFLGK